ncbi:MAG: hypothetical protein ABI321_22145 [Polyangia bacterium]
MYRLLLGLALAGCAQSKAFFSEEPIPLSLAGPGGGLIGVGLAGDEAVGAPMVVDTGAPITGYSDGTGVARATRGSVELFSSDSVPRLRIDNIQLFVAPFGATGLDTAIPTSGVLGGDNLQHFVVGLRYQPSPTLTLTNQLTQSQCDLSERCATVLPFSITGGHQLIDLGDDIFHYNASYVLVDACLEAALDPLEPELTCATLEGCATASNVADCESDYERYVPHGVDIRLAVSTGFPGLGIGASAYDRLNHSPTAEQLLETGGHQLALPSQPGPITVATGSLGIAAASAHDPAARAAITIVQLDGFFGACATVARSRRLRRVQPERLPLPLLASGQVDPQNTCLRKPPNRSAGDARNDTLDELLISCSKKSGSTGNCDDANSNSHTNAYIDFSGAMPIVLLPDTALALQSINADVRPQSATVEGIIGTELLQRMSTTIDYANNRIVMTCADASCRTFPRQGHGTDCRPPVGDDLFGGGTVRVVAGTGCASP